MDSQRSRFDFSHFDTASEQIKALEDTSTPRFARTISAETEETDIETREQRRHGAVYEVQDEVRVILSMGGSFSELCGGHPRQPHRRDIAR